jgi:actin-related protein
MTNIFVSGSTANIPGLADKIQLETQELFGQQMGKVSADLVKVR